MIEIFLIKHLDYISIKRNPVKNENYCKSLFTNISKSCNVSEKEYNRIIKSNYIMKFVRKSKSLFRISHHKSEYFYHFGSENNKVTRNRHHKNYCVNQIPE